MAAFQTEVQNLLGRNAQYAKSFPGVPTIEQMRQVWKQGTGMMVLTCVDPRTIPEQFFGPGLRASVYRNAGGRATDDVVRTLNILRPLANVNRVLVVHHTDCGVTHVTEDEIRDYAKAKNPDAAADMEKMDLGLWEKEHLEQSIKEDVLKLRAERSLDGLEVQGFVLETETGVVREVSV